MQVHALTSRVANSVCVGSVAFVVLCKVSSEAVFHSTGPVVQVTAGSSRRQRGGPRGGRTTTVRAAAAQGSARRCRLRSRAQSMILSMNGCFLRRIIGP